MNKIVKGFLITAMAGTLVQCTTGKKGNPTSAPGVSIDTLRAELLLTLADKNKRNKELDSLYAVIDEGLIDTDTIPGDLLNDIYSRMTGGWGDSNYPDSVSATSFLAAQGQNSYLPKNIHDFDINTAWIEGKEDLGIGESISVHFRGFREGEPLTSVVIYNGYQRDTKSWEQNSRVKKLRMYVNEMVVAILEMEDTMQGQKFNVRVDTQGDKPIVIRFEIVEAYQGSRWKDTAITQIEFDGEWQGI